RFERESSLAAIGRRDDEPMIHEIKINVERSPAVRNWRRGQASSRKIKGGMPAMIDRRSEAQPDLADDLQPQMKRVARLHPVRQRKRGPVRARDARGHLKSLL